MRIGSGVRAGTYDWIAIVAAAAIGIQVGGQITITRSLAADVPPATLALLRYALVLALFIPFLSRDTSITAIRPRDLAVIGMLGVMNFGLMIGLQNLALHELPSGRGALLFSTLPFFTMLISAGCGLERITLAKALGVGLVTLGVGLVIGEKALVVSEAAHSWRGELIMLACAIIAAGVSVAYRTYVRRYSALPVCAWAVTCALGPLAIAGLAEGGLSKLGTFSIGIWCAVAALGASSAFFYWLWLWALGRISPARVNVFQALGPVAASLTAAAFLGEPISSTFAAGVAVVGAGFVLAQRDDA